MEIDWFTVIAQIVNFLILVWLLKRFLYKPVLNAIDEREKKIASQLEDAETKKAEAKKEHNLFRQKNEDFERERTAKMEEVYERANSEKQRLFQEAREESSALRSKLEDSLKQQKQDLENSFKRKAKEEVFAIASKTLSDLANADLEEQVIKVFINKIKNLSKEEETRLAEALKDSNTPILIKSVFELTQKSKQELEKAIQAIARNKSEFQYLLVPDLVSGIVLEAASFQLEWNIESYLEALQKESFTKKNKHEIS